MADQTLTVDWGIKADRAVSGAAQAEAALLRLEAIVDRLGPKLKAVAEGAAEPMQKANRAAKALGDRLEALAGSAGKAQGGLAGVAAAAASVPKPAKAAGTDVDTLGNKLIALRAGMFVAQEVASALKAVEAAARAASQHLNTGADKGLQMRDKAREYANLLGADGPDDKVMENLFGLQRAGRMSFDEAVSYGEQFRGSSPSGLQKGNVGDGRRAGESQEDYQKRVEPITRGIERQGAAFAMRVGMDPATGGDLAGLLPQYGKVPDEKAAAGQLAGMAYGLNEGRGKISVLGRGALGAAASMVNPDEGGSVSRVKDLVEMGVIAGVASVSSKTASGAGTLVKQSDRLLRKMAASDDEEVKKLGITDSDTYIEALRKAAPKIAGAGGDKWLRDHKFTAATERDAARAMAGNLGIIDQRVAKGRAIAADGEGAMRQNAAFGADVSGQNRAGIAEGEIGAYMQTRGRQELVAAMKTAEGQLRAEQRIDTTQNNIANAGLDALAMPGKAVGALFGEEWVDQREQAIRARAGKNLIDAGRKAGLGDLGKQYPGLEAGAPYGTTIDKVFGEVAPQLKAKKVGFGGADGGGPQAMNDGIKAGIDRLVAETQETNRLLAAGADPYGTPRPPPGGAEARVSRRRTKPPAPAHPAPPTPESRALGDPEGTPVTLADGREWALLPYPPRLGGVWDTLYDDNVIRGKYAPETLMTAAYRLLRANYRLEPAEAYELLRDVDPEALVPAVEAALFGPATRHATYSEWVEAQLWGLGVAVDDVPPRVLLSVMESLLARGLVQAPEEFISSDQYRAARARIMALAAPAPSK